MTKAILFTALAAIIIWGAVQYSNQIDLEAPQTAETSQTAITTSNEAVNIEDTVVGTGAEVKNGDTVSVHYVGTFEDGVKFDASRDHGSTFEFTVGAGQVIPGWDQGLLGMKVGGTRKLVVPPSLAYGATGVPGAIPPNSTLYFEIELVGIE